MNMDRAGRGNNNANRGNNNGVPPQIRAVMRGHEQDRARMAQRPVNNEVQNPDLPALAETDVSDDEN